MCSFSNINAFFSWPVRLCVHLSWLSKQEMVLIKRYVCTRDDRSLALICGSLFPLIHARMHAHLNTVMGRLTLTCR